MSLRSSSPGVRRWFLCSFIPVVTSLLLGLSIASSLVAIVRSCGG